MIYLACESSGTDAFQRASMVSRAGLRRTFYIMKLRHAWLMRQSFTAAQEVYYLQIIDEVSDKYS